MAPLSALLDAELRSAFETDAALVQALPINDESRGRAP